MRYSILSSFGILDLHLRQHPIADAMIEEFRRDKVNLAAQHCCKLVLHTNKRKSRYVSRLKLHQHVYVAGGI